MEQLFGRREIYTDVEIITPYNVIEVLEDTISIHEKNRRKIEYLFNYYKGKQPVLERVKEVRPEINNKIVENRANEIVSFKTGYLMGEPVQYVNRSGDDEVVESINQLNEFVFAEDKATKDKELADWLHICGLAYRMILPDEVNDVDESPFEIYTLDPRSTFVVRSSGLGNKPMMAVKYVKQKDKTIFSCYTKDYYFEIEDRNKIVEISENPLGIPIIEYRANTAMLGAFEVVIPLLDAINETASNRLDGIEQFIQALMVLKNADIDDEQFKALKELGGIKISGDGEVEYLNQELNQTQVQTYVDYMYNSVLTICGMPNRNGGSSTSDTGAAVIMRDGWNAAEARAKDTELMFKQSEKEFLKLALLIANTYRDLNLKLSQIEIRFTRRNYENILEKAQVLTTMLDNDKIHPRLAFEHSGMFIDPEIAYLSSMEYAKKREEETRQQLEQFSQNEVDNQKNQINEGENDV
ncbi:MAG: phage portal protein [Faecalibacterium sp.]|nr:phage portal protein [Ruminococcus sp.]MCM1391875.1 phage portal protein [Ruminococcus sp.]MCM1485549.1 phage portal protein [Faecalibacterium sp.]